MANTIKYTDEMVAEALVMRKRGEKQVVIHATFGPRDRGGHPSRTGPGSQACQP